MNATVKGTVEAILTPQVISDKLTKGGVVVNTGGTYSQSINCELMNDKVSLTDGLKVGDTVSVEVNLRGRAWTDKEGKVKYFTSIEGWKIDKEATGETVGATQKVEGDLPF